MDYNIPSCGEIYDRDGEVLAAQSDAHAFYVLPGNVTDESREYFAFRSLETCAASVLKRWLKRFKTLQPSPHPTVRSVQTGI